MIFRVDKNTQQRHLRQYTPSSENSSQCGINKHIWCPGIDFLTREKEINNQKTEHH